MAELRPDQWYARELPVLIEAARVLDEEHSTDGARIARNMPDLTTDEVNAAIDALSPTYIEASIKRVGDGSIWVAFATKLTDQGRRAVGAWPSNENIADKLLAALTDLAEYSDDPVEKSRARKAADGLGSFGRDTLIAVIGAATGVAMQ